MRQGHNNVDVEQVGCKRPDSRVGDRSGNDLARDLSGDRIADDALTWLRLLLPGDDDVRTVEGLEDAGDDDSLEAIVFVRVSDGWSSKFVSTERL